MFMLISFLLQAHHASAQVGRGLPHEVFNVTTISPATLTGGVAIAEACPVPITATESFTVTESCPAPTTTRTIHSIVFPSPDASPVEITTQSQVVTSYIPEATWCVAPAIALSPLPLYSNSSNATTSYTIISEGTGSCQTMFAPLQTTVCATTLTGLASKVTVTDCDQVITFSTECGFTLETPTPITTSLSTITPAPTVKRMFTYWIAPWQSLTAGETPSDVDVKICTVLEDGNLECIRYQEVWEVVVVTSTLTTSRTVQISTTVTGPGTLIVETSQSIITDTVERIDLSTVLLLETEMEIESTSSGPKPTTTIRSTQEVTTTIWITKHLRHKSSSTILPAESAVPASSPQPVYSPDVTSAGRPVSTPDSMAAFEFAYDPGLLGSSDSSLTTTWVTSTTTQRVAGTITVTRQRPRPRPRMIELAPEDF